MKKMAEREKVIRGLELCASTDCVGCPYRGVSPCQNKLAADALALLKDQEPVKPVFERQFMSSIEIYDCGKCGTSLGVKGIAKYCMNCGQAVKWDG